MLKNMKIRTRMIVSYLIIVALLLVAGITSIVMLNMVGNNLQSFYDNQFATVQNALDARRLVFATRSEVFYAIIETEQSSIREHVDIAKADFEEIKVSVGLLEDTFAGDMSLVTGSEKLLEEVEPVLDNILDLCLASRNDEAMELMKAQYMPKMDTVRANLDTAGDTAELNAKGKVDDGMTLATVASVIIIVLVVLAVIISVALALFMSEGIRKPVQEMRDVSSEICKGNMNVSIAYQSKDELGELADYMRQLTESVRGIITDVDYCFEELAAGNFTVDSKSKDSYVGDYRAILDSFTTLRDTMSETLSQIDVAADQVNSGGEQVSSGAQALAQGATEQASSVEELAATINEISHKIQLTAEHAQTAKTEDMKANDEIQVCSSHMDDLVKAMQVIEGKSQDISKVVKTIEDIAFQTNILALNAAVEAARAGTAGKGFAVVADEVRNLATKSQESAKSTTTLIEETIRAVNDGTRISGETAESLQNVVKNAEAVLDAVTLISGATEEQSHAIAEVTTGIDQISSVVQTNSATAEQSAAASEELSGQANLLKEMVGRFTLSNQSMGASSGRSRTKAAAAPSYSGAGGDKY